MGARLVRGRRPVDAGVGLTPQPWWFGPQELAPPGDEAPFDLVLLDRGRVAGSGTVSEVLDPELLTQVYGIGVDRLDYSKGLEERLLGYEQFLQDNPSMRGEVFLLQVTPISRDDVDSYQDIRSRLDALAGRINGAFADMDWAIHTPDLSAIWQDGALSPVDTSAIPEDLSHAWMHGETAHPSKGETHPDEDMQAPAYSWCKAPRLDGHSMETGALARQVVDGRLDAGERGVEVVVGRRP